jgi:hypothetical protein
LVTGVIPEYQKSGIIGPLFLKLVEGCKVNGYNELEMSWVGDYNETVNKIYQLMENATHAKTHATMRYLFNRNLPFERFTNEGSSKSQRNSNL